MEISFTRHSRPAFLAFGLSGLAAFAAAAGIAEAKDLVSGQAVKLAAPLKVAPRSTVALWQGGK